MITPMPPAQSPRAGIGCLGSLVGLLVLVAVVVTVAFVGVIALGVVAALVVIGLVVLAADRLALALSPNRARRAEQAGRARVFVWRSGFDGAGPLIEAAAARFSIEGSPASVVEHALMSNAIMAPEDNRMLTPSAHE